MAGEPDPSEVLTDPRWFVRDYDRQAATLEFAFAEREYWAGKPFLDRANLTEPLPQRTIAVRSLPGVEAPAALNMIWHGAFCGSTLLANLIDKPSRNLSLREPYVLTALARERRHRAAASLPLAPVLQLLARRFPGDASVTVKPNNLANNLIGDAASCTSGKMLFLYGDLDVFLLAIARAAQSREAYAVHFAGALLRDAGFPAHLPADASLIGAMNAAALAWHLNMDVFQRALIALGPARAASLNCAELLSAPAETLRRVDRFFSLGLGDTDAEDIARMFGRHAKTQQPFDAGRHRAMSELVRARSGASIDAAIAWCAELFSQAAARKSLPFPLCAIEETVTP